MARSQFWSHCRYTRRRRFLVENLDVAIRKGDSDVLTI